jgi:hypothetical protein
MKQHKKEQITLWSKRVIGIIVITVWVIAIAAISGSSAPFIEQAPYCIFSTMTIFGLLSLLYKGLERWTAPQ